MKRLPTQFAPWANYRRWINYQLVPDPDRPGKTIKRPVDVKSGQWCKAIDPAHQYSYDEAASTGRPLGFVIMREDGFWFLDADNAYDPATNQWSQLVNDLAAKLQGAAFEVSSSGTGCHWFGWGPVPAHSCKNIPLGIELYTHERFVALTFQSVAGVSVMHDVTGPMADIAGRYFPPNAVNDFAGWTTEPVEDYGGPGNDRELLEAAMRSGKKTAATAFGERHVTFEDLWTRNAERLVARWPGKTDGFDASQADGALAAHLAYWTGKNCERTKELMLQSELRRDKWEARPDYLETTILKATATVTNVAKGLVDKEKAAKEVGIPTGLEGVTFDGDAPIAPPRELIKGLLPVEGIAFLGGQSGAGKTYIAVALAVALAAPHGQ